LLESKGNAFVFRNNIDTDQIFPGRFVEFTDVEYIKKWRHKTHDKKRIRDARGVSNGYN